MRTSLFRRQDAVFYFDLIKDLVPAGKHTASVSVAPRKFVEDYLSVLEAAGLVPVSFEIVPKSLARAVVPSLDTDTKLIIHLMADKFGIYIVDEGVVLFTSTIPLNPTDTSYESNIEPIRSEISKVYGYWGEHGQGDGVSEIILCGQYATGVAAALSEKTQNLSRCAQPMSGRMHSRMTPIFHRSHGMNRWNMQWRQGWLCLNIIEKHVSRSSSTKNR